MNAPGLIAWTLGMRLLADDPARGARACGVGSRGRAGDASARTPRCGCRSASRCSRSAAAVVTSSPASSGSPRALTALVVAGALVASCLRIRSVLEHVLATYVLAWTWVVAVTSALSPAGLVTRGWLTAGYRVRARAARSQPGSGSAARAPPAFRPALAECAARCATRRCSCSRSRWRSAPRIRPRSRSSRPVNEWDSLGYHVARAMFWQPGAAARLRRRAPSSRGSTSTRRTPRSGSSRRSSSRAATATSRSPSSPPTRALAIGVAALARRIGLGVPEAIFGALAFATLPIVAVQASSALNDLVVASFLVAAAVFALRPGNASLVLFAARARARARHEVHRRSSPYRRSCWSPLLGRTPRDWPRLALAGLGGAALGSAWYVVNLVETGEFDGGLAERRRAARVALTSLDRDDLHAATASTCSISRALLLRTRCSSSPPAACWRCSEPCVSAGRRARAPRSSSPVCSQRASSSRPTSRTIGAARRAPRLVPLRRARGDAVRRVLGAQRGGRPDRLVVRPPRCPSSARRHASPPSSSGFRRPAVDGDGRAGAGALGLPPDTRGGGRLGSLARAPGRLRHGPRGRDLGRSPTSPRRRRGDGGDRVARRSGCPSPTTRGSRRAWERSGNATAAPSSDGHVGLGRRAAVADPGAAPSARAGADGAALLRGGRSRRTRRSR